MGTILFSNSNFKLRPLLAIIFGIGFLSVVQADGIRVNCFKDMQENDEYHSGQKIKFGFNVASGLGNIIQGVNNVNEKMFGFAIQSFNKVKTALSQKPVDNKTHEHAGRIIEKADYPLECHDVRSKKGYISTLFRIPGNKNGDGPANNKPPVLIGHGLLSSGADWFLIRNDHVLPYMLADEGYDVWVWNMRGCRYSIKHDNYQINPSQYWDFSVHEMGDEDLPSIIDHILEDTGRPGGTINYVGYSMSTTTFHILLSQHPEYNANINKMVSLAPAIYISRSKSPARLFSQIDSDTLLEPFIVAGSGQFLTPFFNRLVNDAALSFCKNTFDLCENLVSFIAGDDPSQRNKTVLARVLSHTPSNSAVRTILHYFQLFRDNVFQQYDFGKKKNMRRYKQPDPPKYNLANTHANMMILYGGKDKLVNYEDVEYTMDQLVNARISPRSGQIPEYNHLDFMYANSVKDRVFKRILNYFEYDD